MIQNCEEIMNQIKMFRKEMPLMSIFATEGMCDRHWDQINKKCNVNINGKCTFKNIMILGLMNHQ